MTLNLPTTVSAILSELNSANPRGYAALCDLMEFEHPVTIHDDGRVTDGPRDLYSPNLYDDELDSSKWELLNGYSGQDRYSGPIMHPSEFIGGGMARDILNAPGTYVAIVANYSAEFTHEACGAGSVRCRHCDVYIEPDGEGGWAGEGDLGTICTADAHEPEDQDADGWAVARLVSRD